MINPEEAIKAAAIIDQINEIGLGLEKAIKLKYPDCKSHSLDEDGICFTFQYDASGCGCCSDMESMSLKFTWAEINDPDIMTIATKRFEEWQERKIASEKASNEARKSREAKEAEQRERDTLQKLKEKYGDGA